MKKTYNKVLPGFEFVSFTMAEIIIDSIRRFLRFFETTRGLYNQARGRLSNFVGKFRKAFRNAEDDGFHVRSSELSTLKMYANLSAA